MMNMLAKAIQIAAVAKDYGIICPNCKTDKGLIWKSYLMFHKRCDWCGANVKLRNHPEFGRQNSS